MWVLILPARDYYHADKWRTTNISETSVSNMVSKMRNSTRRAIKSGCWKWSKPISQMEETNPVPSGTQQCVGALSIQNILGVWQTHFYICSMSGWESTCLLFWLDATEFAGCSWILNILAVITNMMISLNLHVSWHILTVLCGVDMRFSRNVLGSIQFNCRFHKKNTFAVKHFQWKSMG